MYKIDMLFMGALLYSFVAALVTMSSNFDDIKWKGYFIDCLYPLIYFAIRMFFILLTVN